MILTIIGAGWHGREVLAVCRDLWGERVCEFLDDAKTGHVDGVNVVGTLAKLQDDQFFHQRRFVVAIGGNAARVKVGNDLHGRRAEVVTVVHPKATIWSKDIGIGTVIFPYAIVSIGAKVGQFCIVNKYATVGHGAEVGDGASIADAARFSGKLGECSTMGLHAVAIPGADIGARCTVGAGSVVLKSIPDGSVVAGVPAKSLEQSHDKSEG